MDANKLYASFWSILGILAIVKSFIPAEFYHFVEEFKKKLFKKASLYHTVQIQFDNDLGRNQLYSSTHRYLGTLAHNSTDNVEARSSHNSADISFRMAANQELKDEYQGIDIWWLHTVTETQSRDGFRSHTKKSYKLKVRKKHKKIVEQYLHFILKSGLRLELEDQEKRLYTNVRDHWKSVTFNPPATFDTVAMEPARKKALIKDLVAFQNGKDFYKGVGRLWKRGYLLYGPPGTGKSSLISAIANFTGYDVYDLELTKVKSNTELRQLLININDRSIVVVEDIDCSLEFENRAAGSKGNKKPGRPLSGDDDDDDDDGGRGEKSRTEVTLSGFLNFTDGLWSSCGSEKIFIFTTNYIDRLDPALLRPGRMDFKVHMSYCSFEVFKILASSYLKINDHHLFVEIEELLISAKITPADCIEVLLEHHSDSDSALECLVGLLKRKKSGQEVVHALNRDELSDLGSISSGEMD